MTVMSASPPSLDRLIRARPVHDPGGLLAPPR